MNHRLNGWKGKFLSLAGRVTLTKSALATIPSYVMQAMKLPTSICYKIDQVCGQFIWGSSDSKRKIHLLSWDRICRREEEGGLGFRKS